MKFKNLLFLIILFIKFSNFSFASVKGDFIVTVNNDTIPVVVKEYGCDGTASLICKTNGKKTVYYPETTLYYKHGNDNYESALMSISKKGNKKWRFMKRLTTQKLIFLLLTTNESVESIGGTGHHMSNDYLGLYYFCRRPKESREQVQPIYDLSSLYTICADCPKLVEQLKSKNPEWQGGIENAINYYLYNQNCNE